MADEHRHTGEGAAAAAPSALDALLGLRSGIEADAGSGEVPAVVFGLGAAERQWLRRGDWRLYARCAGPGPLAEILAEFTLADGARHHAGFDDAGNVVLPFDPHDALDAYLSESWTAASDQRRLSKAQLNAFYRVKSFIPRSLQLSARRALIRRQGPPEFPAWPLDASVSALLRFYAGCSLLAQGLAEAELAWFWPDGHRAAIVLTHDVESAEGVRLVPEILDLEEELGFRSSFNFGAWYDVDPGLLRDLQERGFEVGLHGIRHDRSLFASRSSFEAQLPQLEALRERLGATGFRSPATHRVFEWMGELPIEYDCTIPHSDPYEPQPGGCCSLWPFFVGDVVELPYTLPQDHTLFTLLGERTPKLWVDTARAIEEEHGLIQCVTHPDPGYLGDADKRAAYAEFLRAMAERSEVWRALPRDVAAWWRRRATAAAEDGLPRGRVRVGDGPLDVDLEPPGRTP